jgi:TRAP-type C4-dicarboxylate transport system permease small subunit
VSDSPPAAWGTPLLALDKLWVRIEARLAVIVVVVEITTLCFWVSMKGLASYYTPGGNIIGVIFRSVLTGIVLGLIAHLITRKQKPLINGIACTSSVIVGLFLGPVWANGGGDYASNIVAWLQNASALSLIGGPRGLVTRLTLWLALLGGSMAASKGKHINIDIATRYIPKVAVIPVACLGWAVAALVCFAASFGFVDSIAVTKFRAEAFRACEGGTGVCNTEVSERLGVVAKEMRTDFFLLRRQLSLDLSSLPEVLAGDPYDKWMTAKDWNAWLKDGGWEDHYPAASVQSMAMPEDDASLRKMPAVVAPTTGEGRDLLIRDLNFILPFGLFIIALKFLLRILLVVSRQVRFDPENTHADEDMTPHSDEQRSAT